MLRSQRKSPVRRCLCSRKVRERGRQLEGKGNCRIDVCYADQRLDTFGVERQSPFKKAARLASNTRG